MLDELVEIRNYAHLGDAVWEVFVRSYTIHQTANAKRLHKITTERVNATFQKEMLEYITDELSNDELDFVKRARNQHVPVARRNIQSVYRQATAFEALIGYWYIHDKSRLEYFYEKFQKMEFFDNLQSDI